MSHANAEPTTGLSFESALTNLQDLVERLESGTLTLDETIDDFRQATELATLCQRLIAEAELKITELAESGEPDQQGPSPSSFTQVPF